MPFVHSVGDIIRVHRGYFSTAEKNNIYINIKTENVVKSSFLLFHYDATENGSFEPYGSSTAKYTFEENDKEIIADLRKWGKNYFSHEWSLNYPFLTNLAQRVQAKINFDLLVVIKDKKQDGDSLKLTVEDASDSAFLTVDKYFNFLNQGDVVRIRNAKCYNDQLYTSEFSNFLTINKDFYLCGTLKNDKKARSFNSELLAHHRAHRFVPVTTASAAEASKQSLSNVAIGQEVVKELNMLKVKEDDLRNCSKHLCSCGTFVELAKTTSKDKKIKCTQCKKKEDLNCVFEFNVYCQEDLFSNKVLELSINSTVDNVASFFYRIEPVNFFLKENANTLNKFKRYMAYLMNEKIYFRGHFKVMKRSKDKLLLDLVGDYSFENYVEEIFN